MGVMECCKTKDSVSYLVYFKEEIDLYKVASDLNSNNNLSASAQSNTTFKNENVVKNSSNDIKQFNNEEEKHNINPDKPKKNDSKSIIQSKTNTFNTNELNDIPKIDNKNINSCKNISVKENKSVKEGNYKISFNNQNFSQLTFNDIDKLTTENNVSVLSQNKLDTGKQKKITFNNDTKFNEKSNVNSNKHFTLKSKDSQNNESFSDNKINSLYYKESEVNVKKRNSKDITNYFSLNDNTNNFEQKNNQIDINYPKHASNKNIVYNSNYDSNNNDLEEFKVIQNKNYSEYLEKKKKKKELFNSINDETTAKNYSQSKNLIIHR